jgi:hypothetical protein
MNLVAFGALFFANFREFFYVVALDEAPAHYV